MRDQPAQGADPYRTLGLQPGASMAEVKRAYRKLAKAFHPDSAGQAALPRFLAIHEAYEQLVSGRVRPTLRAAPPAGATPAEPWRADPERARAARERARRRTGQAGKTGRTGTSGPSFDAGRKRPTGSSGSTASSGPTGATGPGTREKGRRPVRKATMGSTSYDEARDPADATWSGASWYGPTSGEYWIVNPREYADPRKHGPGYQQRARRPTTGDEVEAGGEEGPAFATASGGAADEAAAHAAGAGPTTARPTTADATSAGNGRPRARATDATADAWRQPSAAARDARRWSPPPRPEWEAGPGVDRDDIVAPLPGDHRSGFDPFAIGSASRDWLGASGDDPIRRLGLALVAWPPIGLAAAAAIGQVTGCASYSVECGGSDVLLPWLAQAAILGLLLLLPPLARWFVGGTIAVIMALVPVTAFLLVVGAGGAPQAGFALGLLLALAWLAGVAWTAFPRGRPGAAT